MELYGTVMETPVGKITLGSDGIYLTCLHFGEKQDLYRREECNTILAQAQKQIREYFEGTRRSFDIPLKTNGTVFQKQVWQALQKIPYGETRSYQQIAQEIGNQNACRAVGMANHRNPIAIIIPCHRVIGKSGIPLGFGGGISIQEKLLELERRIQK